MTDFCRENHKYNPKNTINKGYKLLNKTFREIYKNFRINRKVEKIFYSRVVEPHKSGTPHLHAIIYVKKEYVSKFKQHVKNIKRKNKLGRYDFQTIKDITRSSSYLLKYVQKTTNPETEEKFHFFNGWKKKHRIRAFTHSNIELERYIFKKVNSVLKFSKGLENKNPISELLENCDISINTHCKTTKADINKSYENKNARYKVIINRTRTINEFKEEFWIEEQREVPYFELAFLIKKKKIKHSDILRINGLSIVIKENVKYEFGEMRYNYKVNTFKIIDTQTNETLYNKSDYMLLDDYNYKQCLEYDKVDKKVDQFRKWLDSGII